MWSEIWGYWVGFVVENDDAAVIFIFLNKVLSSNLNIYYLIYYK